MNDKGQNMFFLGLAGLAILCAIVILVVKNNNKISIPSLSSPTSTPVYQVSNTNSNDDLQKDMDTINTSFNATNDSTNNAGVSINETPIPQPNY